MKEVLVLAVLILITSQQVDRLIPAAAAAGQCQVCSDGFVATDGQCRRINNQTQGNYQKQFKDGSNESNTETEFSKSAEEAQRAGDIRPEMKRNWPPRPSKQDAGDNTPKRLLQGINWNQGVQWIYATLTPPINIGWLTKFKIFFANDCPKQAYITLRIEVIGSMWVYVNGVFYHYSYTPIGVNNKQTLTLPVNCGANVIEVYTYNICGCKPAIRFEILQNYCYSCSNTLTGFYNRQTCQCQCLQQCQCTQPLAWARYPTCACKCPYKQFCPPPKYWHPRKCRCQCPPVSCPKGYIFDQSTCRCIRHCVSYPCPYGQIWQGCGCVDCPTQTCPPGQKWENCKCVVCQPQTCPYGQIWQGCGCVVCQPQTCPYGQKWENCKCVNCQPQTCPYGQIWQGCGCINCPPQPCPYGHIWQGCKCVCLPQSCSAGYRWDGCGVGCVPICQPQPCQNGQIWGGCGSGCVICPPQQCPNGQRWEGCGCVPNSICPTRCQRGYFLQNCRCVLPHQIQNCYGSLCP